MDITLTQVAPIVGIETARALTVTVARGVRGPKGEPGATGGVLSDDPAAALGIAAPGISEEASRADHVHAMPSAADVDADPAGSAAAVGAALVIHMNDDDNPHIVTAAQAGAVANGGGVVTAVALTQAAYDAIDPKIATTLYVVTD